MRATQTAPIAVHVLRTKRPVFAAVPVANQHEAGRDADA